jgi:hypothetical protein
LKKYIFIILSLSLAACTAPEKLPNGKRAPSGNSVHPSFGEECLISQALTENGSLALSVYSKQRLIEEHLGGYRSERDPFTKAVDSVKSLRQCQTRAATCTFTLGGFSTSWIPDPYTVNYDDSKGTSHRVPTFASNIEQFSKKLNDLYDLGLCARPTKLPVCKLYTNPNVIFIDSNSAETALFRGGLENQIKKAVRLGLCTDGGVVERQ